MPEHSEKVKLREATVAGIFYPEDGRALALEVRSLLDAASPPVSGAAAILAPHAGFSYSGDLAAAAWKSTAGRSVRNILVLAPQHRAEEALIYLPEFSFFKTPLGSIPVNRALVEELRDCGTLFCENDIPHFEEHGIEVQLPFACSLFPDATLVPVILGRQTEATVKALANALDLVFGPRIDESLIVLSTDLAVDLDGAAGTKRSQRFLDLVAAGDWKAMLKKRRSEGETACGSGCVAAFLASSLGSSMEAVLLGSHDSSACRDSGEEQLVHYAALAFLRRS